MHQDLLKWFFNEYGLDRDGAPPAASQAHFHIKLLLENIQLQDIMNPSVFNGLPERDETVQAEKAEIESAASGDQVIRLMRRGADIANQQALVRKALEFEDEVVPEIIKMLKTSLNELFIEMSVRVLAVCDMDISEELIKVYEEARNPLAKSLALVALGFKGNEKRIPWLVKRYNELKRNYPNEGHCYGAYFALYEMECRFYADSKKFAPPQNWNAEAEPYIETDFPTLDAKPQ